MQYNGLIEEKRYFCKRKQTTMTMKTIILNQRKVIRHMVQNTDLLLGSNLIKLITGPRRVGKSTQALLMLRDKNFAYLNFDNQALLESWDANQVMLILDDVYPGYEYILLDEVQNLDSWDLWVSSLYRTGKNLVITGSNAKMLSSEMATVLTGKYLQVEMLPFSLEEFFDWNQLNLRDLKEEQKADASVLADDYLRNGGYPEVVASRMLTRSYLDTLFDSIIWKDVAKDLLSGEIGLRPQRTIQRFGEGYLYPCSIANQHVFITSDLKMQGCVRASYRKYDLRKGSFDEGWEYLQKEFVDKKSSPNYKCNSCENIRFCEHCVANFMLAYGDEEHVDPFFCRVAELRRNFVEEEIKRLAKGK